MDDGIKLLREMRFKIVAEALGFRSIDHAYRALQPCLVQQVCSSLIVIQDQHKFRNANVMEQRFVAFWQTGINLHHNRVFPPVVSCGDSASISAQPNKRYLVTVLLSQKITEIKLASLPHAGCFGIADVGIVRPDHNSRIRTLSLKMCEERLSALCHMLI